jgi:hypothetical protein
MAKHDLAVTLPKREIGKGDVIFEVRRDDKPFGTLKISKGTIRWERARGRRGRGRARGAQIDADCTWAEFDTWMGQEGAN